MSAREVEEVLLYLQSRLPVAFQGEEAIRFGVVCGSGLGGLVDLFDQSTRVEVPYETIPNFPQSTGKRVRPFQWRLLSFMNSRRPCLQIGVWPFRRAANPGRGHAGPLPLLRRLRHEQNRPSYPRHAQPRRTHPYP